jgi:hypothetical protein
MRTDIDKTITVDFEPDEFQLSGAWTKHKSVNAPINGLDAFTYTDRQVVDFDLVSSGSDIGISRVIVKFKINFNKSHVVISKKSDSLLIHEQGHYYISYIVTVTELCPKILALTLPARSIPNPNSLQDQSNKNRFNAAIMKLTLASGTRVQSLSDAYDAPKNKGGTNHGMERDMQLSWTQKFWVSIITGKPLP